MRFVGLLIVSVTVAGCDVIKNEKKSSRSNEQCRISEGNTPQATPQETDDSQTGANGAAGGADKNADTDSNDETLPFNRSAALLIPAAPSSDVPPPNPGNPPVDPSTPYPVDECRLSNAGNPDNPPVGIDPANPGNPESCDSSLALDAAGPGGGAAYEPAPVDAKAAPGPNPGNACPSDSTATKNAPAAGTNATLMLDWKVVSGLVVYEQGKTECAAFGEGWHLADPTELAQLLATAEFNAPAESNCSTTFWTAGARDQGNQCVATYRGFQYTGVANDPLPINNTVSAQPVSGIDAVLTRHSALCVKGQLKPQATCAEASARFFADRPLGVKDVKGGLTWAKITVKSFSNATDVETQCALGASAGWRMPTKGEFEAAVTSDLFKTAVYEGADPTCPLVWHKPDDAVTAVTCGSLAASKAGEAVFATDAACPENSVYGLCVQANP